MPASSQPERTANARCLAASVKITGPWRVNTISDVTGLPPLTSMVSFSTLKSSHLPRYLYCIRLAGFSSYTYRSSWSMLKIVSPKAMVPLWPIEMPGSAGSPAPITFMPGAFRWAM